MKTLTTLSAALTGAGLIVTSAQAQETTEGTTLPMGATVTTLKASKFNYVGVNFVQPAVAIGSFTGIAGNVLTDDQADFTATVPAGPVFVEILTGTSQGVVNEITSFDATSVTTSDDLSTVLAAGDRYVVRPTPTLASIFGADNGQAGLQEGLVNAADIIWVPSRDEGRDFEQYFYAPGFPFTEGWKNVNTGNDDASGAPIFVTDGIFIQRRGTTDLELVTTGEVKTTQTNSAIESGFNFINTVFPSGSTLANSGLYVDASPDSLTAGNAGTADLVWMPDGNGGFEQFFYSDGSFPFTEGWKSVNSANTDRGDQALTSAIIIQRRSGEATNIKLTPPPSYQDL